MNAVFLPARVCLPQNADMTRYSVIACDQYTSDAAYWNRVEAVVGSAPSTLRMTLPEIYLEFPDRDTRVTRICETMRAYLADGTLIEQPERFIFVERTLPDGRIRRGIVGRVDLEAYDYLPGARTPIRVTEGTITSRIPPRLVVRRDAPLELPHALLLIDDAERQVIEPLKLKTGAMEKLYDFDLMEHGGHIRGYAVPADEEARILKALAFFADADAFSRKYGIPASEGILQIAVGDGNHSLATARAHYLAVTEGMSEVERLAHPARWALAELENLHDESLEFEAIHRVIFDTNPGCMLTELRKMYPDAAFGDAAVPGAMAFAYETAAAKGVISLPNPPSKIAVGALQRFLDAYLAAHPGRIDYIHGEDEVRALGRHTNTIAFILPAMGKDELFPTILHDGALPRKTFSMGDADSKRFYLEARKIR
ncbi:MAG: DUF1015 domain-containing protein [Clostridiaceae bacterium]|nr:DUF1015 domain-containing protein [Clostridiaceae bacterium]